VRLSIRCRLTLWNTLGLGLVLLGFAVLVYFLLQRALYQQIDRKLLAGMEQIQQDRRLEEAPRDRLSHWIVELHEHEAVFAVVYGSNGQILERTQELAEMSVPAPPASPSPGLELHDAALPALGRQRVLFAHMSLAGRDHTVLLMTSLADVDHELTHVLTALLMAVPVALLVAGGMGYLLARKALAPVEQLRRQTVSVTAEHLERRLPVFNPTDELGGLAVAINEMIGRLERSFTEVRRFTADASHELRTPLTALRTEAEVALRRSSLGPEERHLLGSILEECQRLTRLTDQLLILSREDAGVAPRVSETVELAELVRGVVETMRPLAEEQGVSLDGEAEAPVTVNGDPGRLRQVFYNLIENSIKYTPAGGEVEVRVAGRNNHAVVTVRDTGIGIPAEDLSRVFDRFYRVDKARSREQGGTGLGLSIARSIVIAHGGTLELASSAGKGTTCTVLLPVELPAN
jgi:heavy metal sensor kinase